MDNKIIENVLLTIEQYKGSTADFKQAAVLGKYGRMPFFSRLLVWKVCALTETLNMREWHERLRTLRTVYHGLRQNREMRVPWHALDDECDLAEPRSKSESDKSKSKSESDKSKTDKAERAQRRQLAKTAVSADEDPLLLAPPGREAGVDQTEVDGELLRSIVLDVQRLFPGEEFFVETHRRRHIATILYVWAKCNPQVGYKQGMHEILGLIYWNMARESVEVPADYSSDDRAVLALYDVQYLAHDVFALFNRFVVASGVVGDFYASEAQLMLLVEQFNALLMKVDQLVHYNLVTKLRLESQLWIIRYLRLLLARELGDVELISKLWDRLVAADLLLPKPCVPQLTIFLVIVLLLHIKRELMLCDFSEALTLLLRYPIGAKTASHRDFVDSLFDDAYLLYQSRENDLKLYEVGLRLSKRALGGVSVTYSPKVSLDTPLPLPLPMPPTAEESRAAKMAFEKTRLEMRLKKKAQLMLQ